MNLSLIKILKYKYKYKVTFNLVVLILTKNISFHEVTFDENLKPNQKIQFNDKSDLPQKASCNKLIQTYSDGNYFFISLIIDTKIRNLVFFNDKFDHSNYIN